jgi:hypothetical protein
LGDLRGSLYEQMLNSKRTSYEPNSEYLRNWGNEATPLLKKGNDWTLIINKKWIYTAADELLKDPPCQPNTGDGKWFQERNQDGTTIQKSQQQYKLQQSGGICWAIGRLVGVGEIREPG